MSQEDIVNAQIIGAPSSGKFQLFYQTKYNHVKSVLESNQFHIVEVDCSQDTTQQAIHARLMQIFNFPHYYGHNLDALADVLPDCWAIGPTEDSKIALLFTHISADLSRAPIRPALPDTNWLSALFETIMDTFQDTETASAFAFFESEQVPDVFTTCPLFTDRVL